mmetsp:Transcript_16683/g.31433  ORF Transcript_16683/g.31433 Transcript_16683/m.31433 type:complete len:125 (-) Transcript_16683:3781-4155(-)
MFQKVATVSGQPLLLRADINDEYIAGKLFSFMYRVLYGSDAVSGILRETNSDGTSSTQDNGTPASPPDQAHAPSDPLTDVPLMKPIEKASEPNSNCEPSAQDDGTPETPTDPPLYIPSTQAFKS